MRTNSRYRKIHAYTQSFIKTNTFVQLRTNYDLLKPFIGPPASTQATPLPPSAVDNQPVLVPLAILGHKTVLTEAGPKELVLVHWKDLHPDEALWEEWTVLKSLHHLEDEVLFEGSGNDTPNSEDSRRELQSTKPKRQINIPTRLREYVLKT